MAEGRGTPCMVELDTAGLTQEVVKEVEDTCNRHIREHCAVNVKVRYIGLLLARYLQSILS